MSMNIAEARKLAVGIDKAIKAGMENVSTSQLGKNDSLVAYLTEHELAGKDAVESDDFTAVLDAKWPTTGNDKRKHQKVRSDIKAIATVAPHYDNMKAQCLKLSKDKDIQKAYPQCSPAQMFKRLTTLVRKVGALGALQHSKTKLIEKANASGTAKSSVPSWGVDPIGHLKHRLGQLDKNKFTGLEAVQTALDLVTVLEESEAPEVPADLAAAFASLSGAKAHAAIQALRDLADK